jgi:hypothetical protein
MITFLLKDKPVLEQNWPQVDMDYNLELNCVVNNQPACTIKIPRCELDMFNVSMALELLKQDELYIKYNGTQQILKSKFDHYPGLDATLHVITEPRKKKHIETEVVANK